MSTKKRALVQDDQTMFSFPASTFLKLKGFDVDVAVNGVQGLELVGKNTYDIIFSDVEMPNMNGFEFLARLRKGTANAKVPVIMCTTLNKPEHIEKAKSLGANFYIVKPMNEENLKAALKHVGLDK